MNLRVLFILLRGAVGVSVIAVGIEVAGFYKRCYGVNLDWAIVALLFVGVVFSIVFVGQPLSEAFEKKDKD